MRLEKPRVEPIPENELTEEQRKPWGGGPVINIFRTIAHHPKLMNRWLVFGNYILNHSLLPARERELAILRIGWLCRSEYEWAQHVKIGKATGLTDDEITRIPDGADAPGWNDLDRAILAATDELHSDAFVSDETWEALSAHYDTQRLMDLVFTVGQYNMVSMALNSLGVQLEEGQEGLPQR